MSDFACGAPTAMQLVVGEAAVASAVLCFLPATRIAVKSLILGVRELF